MIYLNNAASSWPKAPGVAEAVRRAIEEPAVEAGRGAGRRTDPAQACRLSLGCLLGVEDPSRVVLTANATMALNLAIRGLGLGRGDLVVTTAAEHNSVLRPVEWLRREVGVRVEIVPLTQQGAYDEEAFERALDLGPRLLVLTHASNVTGRLFPVARWFARARLRGAYTLLDASQSLGHVDVSPVELHADLVAFTGHKALLGPTGTGGLWVSPAIELEQLIVGGTGSRSDLMEHPAEMPVRLEAGTPNLAGLAGLAAALEWIQTHGAMWRESARRMAERLRAELAEMPGVELFDDEVGVPRTPVVSFRLKGWSVEEAGQVLEEGFSVACRAGLHCAPLIHPFLGSAPEGTLRFSPSGFTREEEIERALWAVKELSRCA